MIFVTEPTLETVRAFDRDGPRWTDGRLGRQSDARGRRTPVARASIAGIDFATSVDATRDGVGGV
jgi:hypothetical protein